ncbi:MAG TPA: alpha/beta hydrolase [Jatrophihabitans sp.]|nr:alpha/beta hydrolase [Jatrophihabitans sp.]
MPSAPTIVLLHGQPDTSASFLALRRALRVRRPGVRVLVPDRPGYGANPAGPSDYTGNVRWLRSWLARNTDGPVVLVGHSWAGGVGILLAASEPALLERLVLLSSVGPACLLPIDPFLGAPVLGELIAFGTLQLGRPFIARRAGSLIIDRQHEADQPWARASGLAMRFRPVWRSFLHEQRALLRELPAITEALPSVDRPTLVIRGEHDRLIPAATPAALAAGIPQARSLVLDGAHDLQLRQPGPVADAIVDFLDGPQ